MDEYLFSYATANDPPLKRSVIRLVERATGQPRLKRMYLHNQRFPRPDESFWQAAVRSLALDVRYDHNALAAIPKTGPVVVVANHPYGVLDGIVISWLISKVRTDFVVLTNAVLMRAPELQDFILPIDFSETEQAQRTNLASRAAARAQLDRGGVVVVFPAGAVSTAPDKLGLKPAVDWRWQPFASQLIQRSKAVVVPIWFGGQNSRLFQIASHLSYTLRISLIFHEVKSRIGTSRRWRSARPFLSPPSLGSRTGRRWRMICATASTASRDSRRLRESRADRPESSCRISCGRRSILSAPRSRSRSRHGTIQLAGWRPASADARHNDGLSRSRVQLNRRCIQCEDPGIRDKWRFARDHVVDEVTSLFNAARDRRPQIRLGRYKAEYAIVLERLEIPVGEPFDRSSKTRFKFVARETEFEGWDLASVALQLRRIQPDRLAQSFHATRVFKGNRCGQSTVGSGPQIPFTRSRRSRTGIQTEATAPDLNFFDRRREKSHSAASLSSFSGRRAVFSPAVRSRGSEPHQGLERHRRPARHGGARGS